MISKFPTSFTQMSPLIYAKKQENKQNNTNKNMDTNDIACDHMISFLQFLKPFQF